MSQDHDVRNIEAIARKIKPTTFEELAEYLGEEWTEEWQEQIEEDVPGIGDFIEAQRASKLASDALKKGNKDDFKLWRRRELSAIGRYTQWFDPLPAAELAAPPEKADPINPVQPVQPVQPVSPVAKKPESTKVKKQSVPEVKAAVNPDMVESEEMRSCLLGMTGETYGGRPIVLLQLKEGMFGTACKGKAVKATLHKGILNQCAIRAGGATPYWAVLDAMSDLKEGFSKEQVVEKASKIIGGEGADKACGIAFDVLKTHYSHPKKKDCAMSHVVDTSPDGKMSIRGRSPEETQAHFDAMRKRADEADAKQVTSPESGAPEGGAVTVIVGKNG